MRLTLIGCYEKVRRASVEIDVVRLGWGANLHGTRPEKIRANVGQCDCLVLAAEEPGMGALEFLGGNIQVGVTSIAVRREISYKARSIRTPPQYSCRTERWGMSDVTGAVHGARVVHRWKGQRTAMALAYCLRSLFIGVSFGNRS